MPQDVNLARARDAVHFWRRKVAMRFHKNAKKIATWNLWAAEDTARHMSDAHDYQTVSDYDGPKPTNFELPVYRGDQRNPETDEE